MSHHVPLRVVAALTVFSVAAQAASPLADEPSAFLRAHADSPIHWMTWGEAAFARAKAEDKPVFLHIGSFTSELGRAMREQSFAREENAALVNENFVPVLVDRDDRPDLAAFFHAYLHIVKQTQGAPYTIWLTPELKPFDGASYLPPSDEWGKEGFTNATKRVLAAWQADPEAQRRQAEEAVAILAAAASEAGSPTFDATAIRSLVDESTAAWLARHDGAHGGFDEAPKHFEPELLRFMLQAGDAEREAALHTLRAIVASAARDPLDGGFFRYAIDAEWKLPYFQKTLADQARLALALLDAVRLQPDEPHFKEAARDALKYALTLRDSGGGFVAAEDGTPATILPSFLWTEADIRDALGPEDAKAFIAITGVKPDGNIPADAYLGIDAAGKNVLLRAQPPKDAEAAEQFAQACARLRAVRSERPQPLRDDVAPAGDHGRLLAALARAGEELSDPTFATAAKEVFAYIREQLRSENGDLLARARRSAIASPRDHALVIDGLLRHHAASGDAAARELALDLFERLRATFIDEAERLVLATPPQAVPGIPARVPAPPPEGRDLPGAQAAILLVLTEHGLGNAALRQALAARIATDISFSPTEPRGDQLLALQLALAN